MPCMCQDDGVDRCTFAIVPFAINESGCSNSCINEKELDFENVDLLPTSWGGQGCFLYFMLCILWIMFFRGMISSLGVM